MFFKPLKITDDRRVFFTSDTHFNHDVEFVRGARGFSTVSAMDAAIVDSWNSTVAQGDIVFHLGDFVLQDPDGSRTVELLRSLNGYKSLLLGNHNSGIKTLYAYASKHTGDREALDEWLLDNLGVSLPGHYVPLLYHGKSIVLFHFPIASWDGMDDGAWHLCGHSHGSYHASLPSTLTEGKILDVGWDVFGRPVSFYEVGRIMDNKPVITVGHH